MVKIKIAIISDIHANSVALEEIIKDAKKSGAEEYLFLGDQVNDLPFGNETLEIVKKISDKVLKGNKEQYLIEYEKENYYWDNIQFKNTIFLYNELSNENIEYIKKLPHFMSLEYEGVRILISHGSPASVTEFIHEYDDEVINKYTKDMKEDILLFGHTHNKMWHRIYNNKLLINAGCAGVSPHYKAKAEYVLLEVKDSKIINIDYKLIDYDIEKVKRKIIESGILEYDKVLMNLTYLSLSGYGKIRERFFAEAKEKMLERYGVWHKNDAKGIFTYFKLFDDDIWLGLAEKYKKHFVF